MKISKEFIAAVMAAALTLSGCTAVLPDAGYSLADCGSGTWQAGFAAAPIHLPGGSTGPLYIAGYQNGAEITGVLDTPRASALWLDVDGKQGILLISVDCVALGADTVAEIRAQLSDFCRESGCVSVNVIATHTHAGIDTLGLWGPVGVDGKNSAYMENLLIACKAAAEGAYADRTPGEFRFGQVETEAMQFDSREPQHYDETLYQLRFVPSDKEHNGIRIVSYAAHAESLRGDNTLLSRDYPGVMADLIMKETGDDMLFLPASIGGLIMTRDLSTDIFYAEDNLKTTGRLLTEYLMEIEESDETVLSPELAISRVEFDAAMDNTMFMYYKALGILGNTITDGESATGYIVRSEVSALRMGDVTLMLIPGELFPELESGEGLGAGDPESLQKIAADAGIKTAIVVGLANDELGYIIPPSDFVVNEEAPFILRVEGGGEDHYEETNSVGIGTAAAIADAMKLALGLLKK
ncbi:MAG: hypothetical protein E7662_08785 [Ruminococcaceae bacterium]|nr:hypothetical protein [Oscillospiraceae bacterium]